MLSCSVQQRRRLHRERFWLLECEINVSVRVANTNMNTAKNECFASVYFSVWCHCFYFMNKIKWIICSLISAKISKLNCVFSGCSHTQWNFNGWRRTEQKRKDNQFNLKTKHSNKINGIIEPKWYYSILLYCTACTL